MDLLDWLRAWTKVLLDVRVTTFVIAIATLADVIVAFVLWRATEASAEAAKESADAAKGSVGAAVRSAAVAEQTLVAAYRPYFAVSKVAAVNLEE